MTESTTQAKKAHEAHQPVAPFSMPVAATMPPIVPGAVDPIRQGTVQ